MTEEDLNQLLKNARAAGPHDVSAIAFAFETRLATRIDRVKSQAAIGSWAWRLLPAFAALTLCVSWEIWQSAGDHELEIRSSLERGNMEWAYVEQITGKVL